MENRNAGRGPEIRSEKMRKVLGRLPAGLMLTSWIVLAIVTVCLVTAIMIFGDRLRLLP